MLILLREKYSNRTLIISGIILLVLLVALIIGLVKFLNRGEDKDEPRVPETGLYLDSGATTTVVTGGNVNPGTVVTPPRNTSGNETPVVAFGTRFYRNDNLRFTVDVPNNWTIKPVSEEVFLRSPENSRYSIQVYSANGGDMNLLRSTLSAQLNIRNVQNAKFAGYDAVRFDVDGQYGYGYSFIHNGKLYYFLGRGIETSPIAQTFKII